MEQNNTISSATPPNPSAIPPQAPQKSDMNKTLLGIAAIVFVTGLVALAVIFLRPVSEQYLAERRAEYELREKEIVLERMKAEQEIEDAKRSAAAKEQDGLCGALAAEYFAKNTSLDPSTNLDKSMTSKFLNATFVGSHHNGRMNICLVQVKFDRNGIQGTLKVYDVKNNSLISSYSYGTTLEDGSPAFEDARIAMEKLMSE